MAWDDGWVPPTTDQNDKNLVENPVIGWLVDHPSAVPDYVVVRGWLGRSPVQNVWRIYLNIHLTEYLEVAAADVKRAEQHQEWTAVWINRDANVRRITRRPQDPETAYLSGGITDQARLDRLFDHDAYRTDFDYGPDPSFCKRCPTNPTN
jgi:hypothetical protein